VVDLAVLLVEGLEVWLEEDQEVSVGAQNWAVEAV
jgi:hypothetical protein